MENTSHLTKAIFANTRDAVVICDLDNLIIEANPAFAQLTGYQTKEITGQKLFELVISDDNIAKKISDDLKNKKEWAGEVEIFCRVNHGRKMSISAQQVHESEQSSAYYLFMFWGSNKQIQQETYYDKLTSLPNSQLFIDRTEQALIAAPRSNKSVALLMIGLDRFVLVNDGLGYSVGDMVLKAIAERLSHTIRRSDTAARIDGDRFALVMQITSVEDSVIVAEKILKSLGKSIELEDNSLNVTASIGISIFPTDTSEQGTLLKNAESAMRYTKKLGGNHYQFFSDDMNKKAKQRIEMENKLRRAIEKEEFVVYYQPKVNLENNAIVGAEALVRWLDPEQGLISPGEFIPVAEETGLINGIGDFVLRESCRQNSEWLSKGLPGVRVSVNVTASQFREPELVNKVKAALEDFQLSSRYLELEITESMLVGNMEQVIEKLKALREMGIHISIDDFGTGYSSLSYLSRFPVTTLKIDRAFVQDMETNEGTAEITRAIIGLSHGLNLEVVAEGAESIEHIQFLRGQGCDLVQGFFYSRPLPAEEFEKKLTDGYLYDHTP